MLDIDNHHDIRLNLVQNSVSHPYSRKYVAEGEGVIDGVDV